MSHPSDESDGLLELLRRWREGDRKALEELLVELQPWLHRQMSHALAGRTRTPLDSMDLAQQAIANFLTHGPRFVPENAAQLRGLLLRIARNELVDDERRSARSAGHVESRLDSCRSLSGFGASLPTSQHPSTAAARSEEAAWVRLALQFLEPDERTLLLASEIDGVDWATIAAELGLSSADAARMQCARLKPRVARLLLQLRKGRVPTEA